MNTTIVIVLAVVALVAICAAVYFFMKYRARENLRARFGPEYARTIEETGNAREAEARLRERERHVSALSVHPLQQEEKSRYTTAWKIIQTEFVDDPKVAVTHADDLLEDVMRARGYPTDDFDQRAADLSVDHPVVVQNYRAGHEIVQRKDAGTEDLRQAMVHYRMLFDELVNDNEPVRVKAAS